MYLLFSYHHMTPMQYYDMGYGEKQVIKAFVHYEIEEKKRQIDSLNKIK